MTLCPQGLVLMLIILVRLSVMILYLGEESIDNISPLTSSMELLLAPISSIHSADRISTENTIDFSSSVLPKPENLVAPVDRSSSPVKERRPNIPKRCRNRIFQLWEEFKLLFPNRPQKKDAGYYIVTKINDEFP